MGTFDSIDLNPNHLATVKAILAEHVPECEIRAFGSRVTWTAKDYSDLDLAVVGEGPVDWRTLGRLKEAFEESDLPMQVDVLDWHAISESFRNVIERDCVILWDGGKQTTENKWRRHDVSALIDEKILVIGDGYRAKNTELSREGIPFARAGNIKEGFQFSDADHFPKDQLHKVGEKISRSGDTVFTSKGTVGRFAFVTDDTPRFVYSPQLSFWRSLNPTVLEPRFLHYWMAGREFFAQYKSVAGQTDMAEYVSLRDQRRMYITLPPLTEQRDIAHVLGTLDDKIELNRRMSETLEEMARALFKSWFVDFDPVRAKMDGRWRRGESLPGLPANLYDLFPDRLVPSELGEIPEGWQVKALGELVELAYGKTLRAVDRKGGPVPVYGSNGVIGRHDRRLVAGPGIVVGRKGNPGVVTWAHGDFFPIDTTFYVVPRDAIGGLPFLLFALTAQDLPSVSADSAVPGLNRNLAYMNKQLVPDKHVMAEFNVYASSIFSSCQRLDEECRALAMQRGALLPILVSGRSKRSSSYE